MDYWFFGVQFSIEGAATGMSDTAAFHFKLQDFIAVQKAIQTEDMHIMRLEDMHSLQLNAVLSAIDNVYYIGRKVKDFPYRAMTNKRLLACDEYVAYLVDCFYSLMSQIAIANWRVQQGLRGIPLSRNYTSIKIDGEDGNRCDYALWKVACFADDIRVVNKVLEYLQECTPSFLPGTSVERTAYLLDRTKNKISNKGETMEL